MTADDCDVVTIDGAYKLLASEDLNTTVRDRVGRPPSTTNDLQAYLDASEEGDLQTSTNRYSNIWTRARVASDHLNCRWSLDPDIKIIVDEKTTQSEVRAA